MSASKWNYIPAKCDGDYCPGDCDGCRKLFECPPGMQGQTIDLCAADQEVCVLCWEMFGGKHERA